MRGLVNLILLFDDDFVSDTRVRLHGRRALHVFTVHRAQIGERLRVGRAGGLVGDGIVTEISAERVDLDIMLDTPPPPKLPLTLLLALPRPKSLKRVLQCIAAMGVPRVVLLNTWRVEKSFWESPLLAEGSLREQLCLGLEQGRDTIFPDVTLQRRFKPFVQDQLAGLVGESRALVAHPTATNPCPAQLSQPLTLAVGPEGGFIDYEVALLAEEGFEAVTLGARPLRVEQAVPALLGRLFTLQ